MSAVELILWRHAEAEPGEPDLGRRLTPKGTKQARRAAQWLHAQLPDTARIVVSPAQRALQTAQALAQLSGRKPKVDTRLAPDAGVDDVLAAAGWPDGRTTIVLVGHQPTLGRVAARLLCGHEQGWSIRKGGFWWISARQRAGAEQVVLRAVAGPELLS
jgi:phosphohistidine phosphatase